VNPWNSKEAVFCFSRIHPSGVPRRQKYHEIADNAACTPEDSRPVGALQMSIGTLVENT